VVLQATQLLAQDARFTLRGISVCCVCPGSVSTDMNPFGRNTAAQGAAGIAWLVNHPQPSHLNGKFWCERKVLVY
jgi:NAD(P)-dependent dehydrogenase (short-subunit alcohol dehydrogenase family)